jgi:hypothetical protein
MESTRLNPWVIVLDNTYKGLLLTINTVSRHEIFPDDTSVFNYVKNVGF